MSPAAPRVDMRAQIERLYPICRSITGDGVRETLEVIGARLPALEVVSVPSGTTAYDWTVNDEWNVREAYVADSTGRRVVDLADHTLHLVGYSVPVRATLTWDELRPHLHTLPDHPDWIPYRTSYYHRDWGFCLTRRRYDELADGSRPGPYEVVVDATLGPGVLNYGELLIPGQSAEEVLFTAHVCHPSLANDNLAGIAVAVALAQRISALPQRRWSYRFLFAPGTIGSITWLAGNPDAPSRVRHGMVLTGLGGPGPLVYKRTRRGDRRIDDVGASVVERRDGQVRAYSPYGYDERQFNALGFDMPVGRLSRTPHGEYPEYHTSADDLDLVKDDKLVEALDTVSEVVDVLENDRVYRNLAPYGEPQLGKRGLYPSTGGRNASETVMAMLWILAYADGQMSLLEIARRSDVGFGLLKDAAQTLCEAGLLADEGSAEGRFQLR
ncbi:DUF4910 domain-containing protein [Mumia sp. zg.B21]|uniref:DUF4910 domain-containing protein n=1 Tax=Mumia sp. zg.B21 TaxID=2855447 RepID=UPI001C6EAC11|nr:DUF4910 domain-containing protein [Mumia sp. zg.B21]MBW9210774.1 DUF4910 domain-containing protein [Mumia sp. zg.B21]